MRAIFAGMARSYTRKSPYAQGRKAFCDTLERLAQRTVVCDATSGLNQGVKPASGSPPSRVRTTTPS